MLDDISSVRTWDKLNSGMLKMYRGEVLGKLPVIQHFYFGSLLPFTGRPPSSTAQEDEHGHVHTRGTWADCCGIRVPAAFGAAEAERAGEAGMMAVAVGTAGKGLPLGGGVKEGKLLAGPNLRPVPFD